MFETKGEKTKSRVLGLALDIASVKGLENTSIGDVAKASELSRSGLFAHFQSKEQLQIDILKFAEEEFIKAVVAVCEKAEDPIEKLELLKKNWPGWYERLDPKLQGGCIFLTAIVEFDDQPGAVRDCLINQQQNLIKYIGACFHEAQKRKQFSAKYDKIQFSYEFYSLYMGYNFYRRFFGDSKAKLRFYDSVDSLFERAGNVRL
jgi:AcrR family transcriptional regulator